MGGKLPNAGHLAHYRSASLVTPERWLADKLGRTPAGVHQLLYAPFRCGLTLNHLAGLCIAAFAQAEAIDRLARWAAPIRSAFASVGRIELDAGVFRTVRGADSADDQSQTAYIVEPTDANAKRLVEDIDRTVARMLELRSGLVTKHNLERQ